MDYACGELAKRMRVCTVAKRKLPLKKSNTKTKPFKNIHAETWWIWGVGTFVCGCSSKWPTLLSPASEQGRRTNRLYLEVCNKAPVVWEKKASDTTPLDSAVLDPRCWRGHLLPLVRALVCVFNRVSMCLHRISEPCQTTLLTWPQGQEQSYALHSKPV